VKNLIAVPILAIAFMLQTAVISRITLLSGTADLVLLILVAWAIQDQVKSSLHWAGMAGLIGAFVSGLPPYAMIGSYIVSVILARYVVRQTWQTPILALLSVTFFSTIILNIFSYVSLVLNGSTISAGDTVAFITLPSLFLNLIFVIPVHSFISDLALWVYPLEDMV
jgi:rod shape-determining protein MreD